MARKPSRRQSHDFARFRTETLETRTLLALASFATNLYEDAGGVPGALIANDTVELGQTFFVEITAEDVREGGNGLRGLHGISLDIGWDPDVLACDPFEPGAVITPKLPAFQWGTLDNVRGRIDKLTGSAFFSLDLVGGNGPERFALLRFQAIATATDAPLRLRGGAGGIAFYPLIATDWRDFEYELSAIDVVDGPPEAASAPPAHSPTAPAQSPPASDAAPPVEVQFYQGSPTPLPSAAALDTSASFFVQVTVHAEAAAADAPQSKIVELAPYVPAIAAPQAPRGRLWMTGYQVELAAAGVKLPIVMAPVDELAVTPRGTIRVGLLYVPDAAQAAATDAVFGAAASQAPPPAAGRADAALLQALLCGLILSGDDYEAAANPFDPIPV